jgi:deazaflavin-dependent oxidoreductase (nitroreductase family)
MKLQQHFRRGFLIMLKYTLNRVTRRLARSSFGPFAIVRHVGRRSGKVYETPIIVAPVNDGFVIELTYGHDVDWHKNVVAAGGCTLIWHGQDYLIDTIAPLDTEPGRAAFTPFQQQILRLLRRTHFEKMMIPQ